MAERGRIGLQEAVVNLFILLVVLVGAPSAHPIYSGKSAAELMSKHEIVHRSSRRLLQTGSGSGAVITSDAMEDDMSQSSTDDIFTFKTTRKQPPPESTETGLVKIVDVLAGTLVTLIIIVIVFIVVIIILIIIVIRINRRRKVERDLVLRTKQDIFEGVPSGVTQEEMSSINKYNVDVATLESSVTKDGDEREAESRASLSGGGEEKGAENQTTGEENSQREVESSNAGVDEHSSNDNVTSSST